VEGSWVAKEKGGNVGGRLWQKKRGGRGESELLAEPAHWRGAGAVNFWIGILHRNIAIAIAMMN